MVSVWFVIDIPLLHFVWIIGTIVLAFYAVAARTNYTAAIAFINVNAAGIPLWDRHAPAKTNVGDALWLCLAVLIGVVATDAVELSWCGCGLKLGLSQRLPNDWRQSNLLTRWAEARANFVTEKQIMRPATHGTSLLRLSLHRSDYSPQNSAELAGAVVLLGRLVELEASLTQLSFESQSAIRDDSGI